MNIMKLFYERDVNEEAAKNKWLYWQVAVEEKKNFTVTKESNIYDTFWFCVFW
jgi:hypothetical protein